MIIILAAKFPVDLR